jgi:hypothetical protein
MSRTFASTFVAAGVLISGVSAAGPAPAKVSLDDRYFEREANNYTKYQYEGQVIYCQEAKNTASLLPHNMCITEAALRQRVENERRTRNPVVRGGPQYVATVPGGSGT